ncbi:MAG: hypothetical protein ACKO5E_02285, partial [bacterium]
MGMKISVGLQKKVGQANYGSLGASCHVEFEIDAAMIENNLEGFHDRVNGAYQACRQAVNAQLRQQQEAGNTGAPAESRKPPQESPSRAIADRGGSVTPNQLKAIYAIYKRLRLNPQLLVNERFDCHV